MAVTWNKIYRGGVQRTTPETREVAAPTTGTVQPGVGVTLSSSGVFTLGAVAAGTFFYLLGEPLHGTVDDNVAALNDAGTRDTVRLYSPRSGDLYAGRCAAGIALRDDLPLSIGANGLFIAAVTTPPEDATAIVAYVDNPASAHPGTTPTTTTAGQLVPIKIK